MRTIIGAFLVCALSCNSTAQETEAYTWAHALTLESITNVSGGVEKGTHNLANLDLTLSVDTNAAGWWDKGTFFVYVLGNYGKPPSALSGELQAISNIEADENLTLYEFWYEHSFASDSVKLLLGLHDFNSTFYALESASLFNQSSMGIGPEVAQVSPSIFPISAATIHLTVNHNNQYFLLAVYDGVPGDPKHPRGTHVKFGKDDGLFMAAEWGVAKAEDYKLGLGAWRHTAKVENPIDNSVSDSNGGLYLIGERYFGETLAAFFQLGYADPQKNQLTQYMGTGITAKNWLIEGDSVGMSFARAKNSKDFLRVNTDLYSAETVTELSYFRPLMDKVSMQASVYSIQHPSMSLDTNKSVALGFRFYIEF